MARTATLASQLILSRSWVKYCLFHDEKQAQKGKEEPRQGWKLVRNGNLGELFMVKWGGGDIRSEAIRQQQDSRDCRESMPLCLRESQVQYDLTCLV